jgi:SAM-dependent methyltransferase
VGEPSYLRIVEHYQRCFDRHGATHLGVDWPKLADVALRHEVMFGVCREASALSLLDLGCGYGEFVDFLARRGDLERIDYRGIDLSATMIDAARRLHPGRPFDVRDILREPLDAASIDYVIMNGVLTERVGLGEDEMAAFARDMVAAAYRACRKGIAFNVMSHHVDRKREDLFHWPFDEAAAFIKRECSRHLVFRADYGLYEYTAYVYREPGTRGAA